MEGKVPKCSPFVEKSLSVVYIVCGFKVFVTMVPWIEFLFIPSFFLPFGYYRVSVTQSR